MTTHENHTHAAPEFDWRGVVKPAGVAALTLDHRGYPVPVVSQWINGVAQLGALSEFRMTLVGLAQLCGVCGRELGEDVWAVGDDESIPVEVLAVAVEHNLDVHNAAAQGESPVHLECGLYAVAVCPYLANPSARRSNAVRRDPKGAQRPKRVVLRRHEGVRFVLDASPEQGSGFVYGPPREFRVIVAGKDGADQLRAHLSEHGDGTAILKDADPALLAASEALVERAAVRLLHARLDSGQFAITGMSAPGGRPASSKQRSGTHPSSSRGNRKAHTAARRKNRRK